MPHKVTYHCDHRNGDPSEDIYKDSESESVPEDTQSFVDDLDPDLQEVYNRIVEGVVNEGSITEKDGGVGMVVEFDEGGTEGHGVIVPCAPVRSPEDDRAEELVSTSDSVSLSPQNLQKIF